MTERDLDGEARALVATLREVAQAQGWVIYLAEVGYEPESFRYSEETRGTVTSTNTWRKPTQTYVVTADGYEGMPCPNCGKTGSHVCEGTGSYTTAGDCSSGKPSVYPGGRCPDCGGQPLLTCTCGAEPKRCPDCGAPGKYHRCEAKQ